MPVFDAEVVMQVVFKYRNFEAATMGDAHTVAGDKARAESAAGAEWYISDMYVHRVTPEVPPIEELM